MSRDIVFTTKAATLLATFCQAVNTGGLAFVSGTRPYDPSTCAISGNIIQEQTSLCLKNISAILTEAESLLDKILSATVILIDEGDFSGMNEKQLKLFPTNPPARQAAKLPVRILGMKISIAAIAET